jgi:chaperonin GroEL (HSP60 family)
MLKSSQDLGSHVVATRANGSQTAAGVPILTVAGATEDGVKVTGLTVDRFQGTKKGMADSLVLALTYNATLANTKTIAFAIEYQESADDSTWDTAIVVQASTVAATGDGVSTEFTGVVEKSVDLRGVATAIAARSLGKRYIRFNITPDLSNTGTDEAAWEAVAILAGFDQLPQ